MIDQRAKCRKLLTSSYEEALPVYRGPPVHAGGPWAKASTPSEDWNGNSARLTNRVSFKLFQTVCCCALIYDNQIS